MTNDTQFSPRQEMTTRRLARKFKVKTDSIHHAYWLKGHFHGWEPTGHSVNSHEYVWRFVGEEY